MIPLSYIAESEVGQHPCLIHRESKRGGDCRDTTIPKVVGATRREYDHVAAIDARIDIFYALVNIMITNQQYRDHRHSRLQEWLVLECGGVVVEYFSAPDTPGGFAFRFTFRIN